MVVTKGETSAFDTTNYKYVEEKFGNELVRIKGFRFGCDAT